jgi:hypothetical protein
VGRHYRMAGWRAIGLVLAISAVLGGCNRQGEEVRQEALAGVESALQMAEEGSDTISPDPLVQTAWSEALVALGGAHHDLSDCGGKTDSCLESGLSLLLDADRQLLLVEQIGGVVRPCDFSELQNQLRDAAGLLYAYLYRQGAPVEVDDWRGPPTPRPPGVCPAG